MNTNIGKDENQTKKPSTETWYNGKAVEHPRVKHKSVDRAIHMHAPSAVGKITEKRCQKKDNPFDGLIDGTAPQPYLQAQGAAHKVAEKLYHESQSPLIDALTELRRTPTWEHQVLIIPDLIPLTLKTLED